MPDCLFCRIVAREIPATIVHETPLTLAFRDVHPQAPTHVLVIPKEHVGSLMALTDTHDALVIEMARAIRDVAAKEGLQEKGFRLVVNNGKDANQTVAHLHHHILAGRRLGWPPG